MAQVRGTVEGGQRDSVNVRNSRPAPASALRVQLPQIAQSVSERLERSDAGLDRMTFNRAAPASSERTRAISPHRML